MDSLDLLLLEHVAGEQRTHQQHNQNKERPGAKELLGCSFGRISYNPLSSAPAGYGYRRPACVPSSGSVSASVALPLKPKESDKGLFQVVYKRRKGR